MCDRFNASESYSRISLLDEQIVSLKKELALIESERLGLLETFSPQSLDSEKPTIDSQTPGEQCNVINLDLIEYKRYGRQMVVPAIGRKGMYFFSFVVLVAEDEEK